MYAVEPLLQHVVPFVLVTFRMVGLFLGAPLLSSRTIPVRFRVLLSIMLGVAIYPMLPSALQIAPDVDLPGLAAMMVSETLLGLSIGVIAAIPLSGLSLAGHLIGHQMGLALAQSYDPETNAETDAIGQLLYFLGAYVFMAVGGLDALFVGVLNTFQRLPIGALNITDAPLDIILGVLSSSFELAVRVSTPVLAIILMILIALGFLMKTMPQINILSVGFAIKILVGIMILAATLVAVEEVFSDEILGVLDHILLWTRTAS